MKNIILLFLFFSLSSVTAKAQITVAKASELIIGTWEGEMPLKMAKTDSTMNPVKIEAFVDVKFEITFGKNQKDCDIEPIEIDSIYYVKPERQEIRQILNSEILFRNFIHKNNIEILGYQITPELNLNINIDKELSSAGAKLDYLTQDMEDIKILNIDKDNLELSIPTRSKWSEEVQKYIQKKYVTVKLKRVKTP